MIHGHCRIADVVITDDVITVAVESHPTPDGVLTDVEFGIFSLFSTSDKLEDLSQAYDVVVTDDVVTGAALTDM